MKDDTVISLTKPADALTEVLREGARKLLHAAIESEVEALLSEHASVLTARGNRAVIRNGYLPEREIQTGIGMVGSSYQKSEIEAAAELSLIVHWCRLT